MNILKLHYHGIQDETIVSVENYIKDICASDCAVAEPSSDSSLDWLMTTLIVGVTECYFDNLAQEGLIILGFACETCRNVEIRTQPYMLEPELILTMMADNHHSHDFVAIYLEV
jgi:hypothetical protein